MNNGKMKFVYLVIILIAFLTGLFTFLTKYNGENNKNSNGNGKSNHENEQDLDYDKTNIHNDSNNDELPISKQEEKNITADMIKLTESYRDLYSDSYDENRRMNIANRLASQDKIVTISFYEGVMKNSDKMNAFCQNLVTAKSNKETISLYYVQVNGGLLRYDFDYQDGKLIFTACTSEIKNGKVTVPYFTRYQLNQFSYTEKGWFFMNKYSEEDEDSNAFTAIRVKPQDPHYIELCRKYIDPIGYNGNNLFLVDWDNTMIDQVAMNDLYIYLKHMQESESIHKHEFEDTIEANEFEETISRYFQINSDQIKTIANYNSAENSYNGNTLTCIDCNPDFYGAPIPEVVNATENSNGTLTLTVDGIWEWYHTDHAFTHEITIKVNEDGSFNYIANKIIPSDKNILPVYQKVN